MPAPTTVPATAATTPVAEPNRAPAARFSSGRGTNAAVQIPYPAAKSSAAAPVPRAAGMPVVSSCCGSRTSIAAPAETSTSTSRESRDHGDISSRAQRTAADRAGRTGATGAVVGDAIRGA